MIVEPLELEVLASLTNNCDEVHIIDMILESRPIEYFYHYYNPDIVCITGYITHIPVIIDYCMKAKTINPKIVTIVGGVHIEKFPEDIQHDSIDYRIVRNATILFPKLLSFIKGKNGYEIPVGILANTEVLDETLLPPFDFYFPHPNRNLTKKYRNKYFYVFHNKVALLKTSFGCPYKCNFCFCRKITNDIFYARPLKDVMQELEGINEKEIYIVDDDFLFSALRVEEFINQLKYKNIKKRFLVYGRADFIAKNPELIKNFKSVGLRTIIIGLESFIDEELHGFNKNSLSSANEDALQILQSNNIDCYAAIILSPDWKYDHFELLRKKLIKFKVKFINLQPLTPLKGTGININDSQLAINRQDYELWDLAHISIFPENMNLAEFYKNIIQTYKAVVFRPEYIISHLKYSVKMHWKLGRGLLKINKQYKRIYKEAMEHA